VKAAISNGMAVFVLIRFPAASKPPELLTAGKVVVMCLCFNTAKWNGQNCHR